VFAGCPHITQIIFGVEYKWCRALRPAVTAFLFIPASARCVLLSCSLHQQISSVELHVTSLLLVPASALKLCHYLRVRDQVSRLYKTTDKVTVIYVVILIDCHISLVIKSDSQQSNIQCYVWVWKGANVTVNEDIFIHIVKGRHILSVAEWIHSYSHFF
jgi:hypothetical protein